ncbi:MAG: hypothetical protein WD512_14925, partial [Candidatus Paceibacterota bacterium]
MDQSKEESISITILPKLIKDKIDDYNYQSYLELTNRNTDEMLHKMKELLRGLQIDYCNEYDMIDGRKIYCLQRFYYDTVCYNCYTCVKNYYYCIKHAIENLSSVLTDEGLFCGLFCNECLCSNKHNEYIKNI